jgi:hypothetical protein
MARFLAAGIAMLITGLAPDVLIVVGEITRLWPRVGPIVDDTMRRCCRTGTTTKVIPTDPEAQPRLRGTIALVMQKHFGAPLSA